MYSDNEKRKSIAEDDGVFYQEHEESNQNLEDVIDIRKYINKELGPMEQADILFKKLNLRESLDEYQSVLSEIMLASANKGFVVTEDKMKSFHDVFAFGFKFGIVALHQALLKYKK